ncbi:hypothetical protein Vadar_006015 [Vaccinium darrowii]|uniref:Uncharacterized protein n=1 Tax=Vaccinium darrowii TaxID=229202 RepID=A0ACB7Y5C5_9ERIC|nr:hypothetical protein Vadar_006015 [Vaccinium darrowii]
MAFSLMPNLLIFLSLLPFVPLSGASTIALNSSLSASTTDNSSSWKSPSGDFAFGFRQVDDAGIFLLAIWFDILPIKTIVWHANTSTPVLTGSKVDLSADGLTLTSPQGETIWNAQPTNATAISYASMLDTGNFVLSTGTSNDFYAWQSFDYPTDTILPNQTLPRGGMLYSRLTETNYSRGRFELRLTAEGNLELNPIAWPSEYRYASYYTSGTASTTGNSSESGFELVFNQADIYIVRGNGDPVKLWNDPAFPNGPNYPASYHRATLGYDGVFRQYTFPRSSDGDRIWSIVRHIPDNICTLLNEVGSGACGFNSYCMTTDGTPNCQCPEGYSLMDPDNKLGGCEPNFPLGCEVDDGGGSRNQEDLYELKRMEDVDWPLGEYETLRPYNQTQCEQSCLHDCSCAVAIFSEGNTCRKKRLPVTNGRLNYGVAIIKVRKGTGGNRSAPDPTGTAPKPDSKKENQILMWTLISGSSGLFNIVLLAAIISLVVILKDRKKLEKLVVHGSDFPDTTNLRIFTFKQLKEATDGFKEDLGSGSFGTVYKGVLPNSSKNQVAVKVLEKLVKDGEREFNAEVSAIGKTHHRNLVQLLGYCNEGPNRMLVYEFMSNGSLADFLFGQTPRPDWYQRTQLALGIARGLVYLHEECSTPIIHCDIKPENILLDEYFTARISDFGLAKSLALNQTRTQTGIRGTRGYVAPEWFRRAPVTVKVDVYSFGVMLLEVICCRRSVEIDFEDERVVLTDWAYDCYKERRLDELVDNEEAAMRDIATLRRWVKTALCCVQESPTNRPTMNMVIQMLEGYVEVRLPTCITSSFCL